MATLILDIETVGWAWQSIDDQTQHFLSRWIEHGARSREDRALAEKDVENSLGLSPFTGEIIVLGVHDRERARSTVYYVGDGSGSDQEQGGVQYKERTEKKLLEEFWSGVAAYDTLVTFNGRGFALPFILHRSVAGNVSPTRDFLRHRYPTKQKPPYHIDLCDELSFYSALTRPPLHLVCRAYGIASPKDTRGGDEVAALYVAGKYQTIAEYNARDLVAIVAVYEKWLQFLAPRELVQSIDF
jgi:uncharacterized protein YprB with RNaseH-like and TPR domain